MSKSYKPWLCRHDKPLDVLELNSDAPRIEWCMECGSMRKETLGDDGWESGEWEQPSALKRERFIVGDGGSDV